MTCLKFRSAISDDNSSALRGPIATLSKQHNTRQSVVNSSAHRGLPQHSADNTTLGRQHNTSGHTRRLTVRSTQRTHVYWLSITLTQRLLVNKRRIFNRLTKHRVGSAVTIRLIGRLYVRPIQQLLADYTSGRLGVHYSTQLAG